MRARARVAGLWDEKRLRGSGLYRSSRSGRQVCGTGGQGHLPVGAPDTDEWRWDGGGGGDASAHSPRPRRRSRTGRYPRPSRREEDNGGPPEGGRPTAVSPAVAPTSRGGGGGRNGSVVVVGLVGVGHGGLGAQEAEVQAVLGQGHHGPVLPQGHGQQLARHEAPRVLHVVGGLHERGQALGEDLPPHLRVLGPELRQGPAGVREHLRQRGAPGPRARQGTDGARQSRGVSAHTFPQDLTFGLATSVRQGRCVCEESGPCPLPLSRTRPCHTKNSVSNSCVRRTTRQDRALCGHVFSGGRKWQVFAHASQGVLLLFKVVPILVPASAIPRAVLQRPQISVFLPCLLLCPYPPQ